MKFLKSLSQHEEIMKGGSCEPLFPCVEEVELCVGLQFSLMIVAMLTSACGMNNRQDKIAVVDWAKGFGSPSQTDSSKLHKMPTILCCLAEKTRSLRVRPNWRLWQVCNSLKQNSKQNYLSADLILV
jgi:hypothetical protein